MVSPETVEGNSSRSIVMDDSSSSPRISFSADSIATTNLFITIKSPQHINDPDFEFLSSTQQSTLDTANMLTADELFAEGKLLPFWQVQKLNHAAGQEEEDNQQVEDLDEEERRRLAEEAPAAANGGGGGGFSSFSNNNGWFMEEDPSPRPPNCTVLFKELLRLKKQRRPAATLSPSSSTSSSSSSLGGDVAGGDQKNNSNVKRVKKASGLERTRSATIRIRPMVNVPICTAVKTSNVLPPLFPTRKGRLGR